jgi:hypothetical protein
VVCVTNAVKIELLLIFCVCFQPMIRVGRIFAITRNISACAINISHLSSRACCHAEMQVCFSLSSGLVHGT